MENTYLQSNRLMELGRTGYSPNFLEISKAIFDGEPIVRKDAIIALGLLGDSRSYFVLAALFRGASFFEDPTEIKKSIIYSLSASMDLRGRELLERTVKENDLKKMSKYALRRLGKRTTIYSYLGKEEDKKEAKKYSGTELTKDNLGELEKYLLETDIEHPQTYIIDISNRLKLGFEIEEHIQVASGEKVLSAGEIVFSFEEERLKVETINNRSNSFFPHESTIERVTQELENLGFDLKKTQTQAFPRYGWLDDEWLKVHATTVFRLLGQEYHHWNQSLFSQK